MSAAESVSSLVVSTNLPSSCSARRTLARSMKGRPSASSDEVRAEALGGDQAARSLGMIAGETVELELQEVQDLVAVALLPRGLLGVQAEDVAPAPLALADDHLLGAQVRRDLGVAPGAAQNLVLDLLHPADRRRQDVAAGAPAQLGEIGPGVEPVDEGGVGEPLARLASRGDLRNLAWVKAGRGGPGEARAAE